MSTEYDAETKELMEFLFSGKKANARNNIYEGLADSLTAATSDILRAIDENNEYLEQLYDPVPYRNIVWAIDVDDEFYIKALTKEEGRKLFKVTVNGKLIGGISEVSGLRRYQGRVGFEWYVNLEVDLR